MRRQEVVNLVATLLGDAATAGGDIDQLIGAAKLAYTQEITSFPAPGSPCPQNAGVPIPPVVPPSSLSPPYPATNNCVLLSNLVYGLGLPAGILAPADPGGLKAQTKAAADALLQVVGGIDARLLPGMDQLIAGLQSSGRRRAKPSAGADQVADGDDVGQWARRGRRWCRSGS